MDRGRPHDSEEGRIYMQPWQVRGLMEYLGVSGVELAKRLGVNRVTVAGWRMAPLPGVRKLRGVSRQSATQLYVIAREMAREQGKALGPLRQFFSREITRRG